MISYSSCSRVMNLAGHHRFQLLTKRAERLSALDRKLPWHDNVWMGVTVETADYVFRIDHLRDTGARTKFLSLEPLLGLSLILISGVSTGSSLAVNQVRAQPIIPSGSSKYTTVRPQMFRSFFKQWGGKNKKKSGSAT